MAVEKVVLVVSPTPSVAEAAANSAQRCGYTPVVVRSFAEAKRHLRVCPHLLVTELKLAEYNGLQLALRARVSDVPSIVIAEAAYEHEIERHGATWMSPEMAGLELPAVMTAMVQGPLASGAGFGWQSDVSPGAESSGDDAMGDWHPTIPSASH